MNALPGFRMPSRVTTARAGVATVWLAVMLGAAAPAFGQSPSTDPVVAVVNGSPIHESELELADEIIGRNLLVQDPVERRETLLKMVTDAVLLAKVATDRHIEDQADLQRRAAFARNQGLTNHLLTVVGQQAVTEDAMRKAYQEVVLNGVTTEPELHLRHLIFMIGPSADDAAVKAAEQKAKAAMDRINKGEDFAAVVAELSEDPVTKARGGDYDWRQRGEMGKEYADVAAKLKKGEVSQPFKTAVGWHILKLEDTRPRKPADYDKIRDRLAAMVASAAQIELVDKVRAEAKIERPDQGHKADKESSNVR
ncbi:peptidylprolyl isomerase [Bradyrhizobium sp.]|jgi:peptidylprolyl isomerase/peptidyl-prolyl cis-trans isomerase C|uniref:peptidylprolyl isomerase n=1 Tax=Bradyrhizobium sp. TaxID=376 RepID=UPI002DDD9F69|nr:peptidylprolyl isomerase [Bradyrhizobium sp.]HEV2156688.1 peptidylprolyl isomerase [Bradyrhizobium sp.]